jgi:hypothetical protein
MVAELGCAAVAVSELMVSAASTPTVADIKAVEAVLDELAVESLNRATALRHVALARASIDAEFDSGSASQSNRAPSRDTSTNGELGL